MSLARAHGLVAVESGGSSGERIIGGFNVETSGKGFFQVCTEWSALLY